MRFEKLLVGTLLVLSTATSAVHAQTARPFRDSWFWGVGAGLMTYGAANPADSTQPGSLSVAPTVTADWLITRTHGGLLLSASQSFLASQGTIINGPTAADSGLRFVDVTNARRFDMAIMAFPGNFLRWHPYVGAGFTFRYLSSAVAGGDFTTARQIDFANSSVNDVRASMGPLVVVGSQYRLKALSAYAQVTAGTVAAEFLLANGHSFNTSMQFGLRYNVGSSIDH